MTQQLVLPIDKALAMFPKTCPQHAACERTTRVGSITHLPGPIACERCGGEPRGKAPGGGPCQHCDGLGYPPELEIVSETIGWPVETGFATSQTWHGVVKLGPPVLELPNEHFDQTMIYPITVVET